MALRASVILLHGGSVGLDPGQTCPSMGQVGLGWKVNRLTDPSVERHCVDPVTLDFAAMVKIHDESRCCSPSTIICIIW
jgi:hypothetical protein